MLSRRELQVLGLIAQGMRDKQIADHLIVSYGTVKTHGKHIRRKLGVKNRTQAARFAHWLGAAR